jgi:hypothetical protein
MPTQLVSLIFVCVVFSMPGGTTSTPGTVSADVVPMQVQRFPEIPPSSAFDTTSERSDRRRLMIGGNCPERCRPGPLAWVHPRTEVAAWGRERRDAGEVIARLISYGAYPKFNLQDRGAGRADTVFWAVMKVGDSVISVFRSTKPGTPDLVTPTFVRDHGPGFFRGIAYARFVWSDRDDAIWGTCDTGACCRVGRI